MPTVDISSAYRSVLVHPSPWKYLGLRWTIQGTTKLYTDTQICFGRKCAPFYFFLYQCFVVQCMHVRGYHKVYCYLDDFILVADSLEKCQKAQLVLIKLMGELGLYTNWKKCSSPSTTCKYLGVEIDSDTMKLRLPIEKLEKLHHELKLFESRRRAWPGGDTGSLWTSHMRSKNFFPAEL